MKPVDFVWALCVAIVIILLDFACAFGFVFTWVQINHPAQSLGMMDPLTIELSTLSTRIFGPLLFALFVWLFARRRSDRPAYAYALSVFGFYCLLDWSIVAFQGILEPAAIGTMLLKLCGALFGAWLARRSHSSTSR